MKQMKLSALMEAFVNKLNIEKYSLYLMDYGAPIGFRLASKYPDQVQSLIVQNGNAYEEGLREFWDPVRAYWKDRTPENAQPLAQFISPDGVKWQYTHGVRNEATISPDNVRVPAACLRFERTSPLKMIEGQERPVWTPQNRATNSPDNFSVSGL